MSYRIYFGGDYIENWSNDYRLSVSYSERVCVEAEEICGTWKAVSGDEHLMDLINSSNSSALAYRYFCAAAEIKKYGGENYRIDECSFDDAAAVPELLRFLLDERGYRIEDAIRLCAKCCRVLDVNDLDIKEYSKLQPRSAALISAFSSAKDTVPTLLHDSSTEEYRAPLGALRCGDTITLSVKCIFGNIERVSAVIDGKEIIMEKAGKYYRASFKTPEMPAAMEYIFKIKTADKTFWLSPEKDGHWGNISEEKDAAFRLTVYKRDFETPKWFKQSVMYQIFPDRFAFEEDGTFERGIEYHRAIGQNPDVHKSTDEAVKYLPRENEAEYEPDDFYGGNFKGIEKKLPYLQKLGISCIYLNPIFEARSNHRYDTADYLKPDPILGTDEEFKNLAHAASEYGIKIILDGVFSHTGADSIYFNKYGHYDSLGAYQGSSSRFYKWYDFKSFPAEYRSWWGFKELPEVDENDPDWQQYIISGENSAIKLWLKKGASGWRLDVADELPDNVLAMIRKAVKDTDCEAPIIGEVWEDAVTKISYGERRNYALGYSLDSVMNYPLRSAILNFAQGRTDAYQLRDFLISQQLNYPKPLYYSLMNLLGSHDVERLITSLATDIDIRALSREEQIKLEFPEERMIKAQQLEKLCAAIQFALPGVPSIYYGDEQGMEGVCDPFNRMPFKDNGCELYDYYSILASNRNNSPEIRTGYAVFEAHGKNVISVLRYIADGKDAFGEPAENGVTLIAVNRGREIAKIEIACSKAWPNSVKIEIPPESWKIIKIA